MLARHAGRRFSERPHAPSTLLAALPLVWLAVVTPIALRAAWPSQPWPYLLGGLFLASLVVSIEFVRASSTGASWRVRSLVARDLDDVVSHCRDTGCRSASRKKESRTSAHSLSSPVFCSDADGDPILRRFGFDLERSVTSVEDSPASSCRQWYRAQKHTAFTGLLKGLGRDPFAPPQQVDPLMVVYCPRCHGQFGEGTDACSDCVGSPARAPRLLI